jgi:hypothetical protein
MVKDSAAHCNAVLLFLCSCLGLLLVMWVNQLFYLGVLEHVQRTTIMADRHTTNSRLNKNIQDRHIQQANKTIRQTQAVQGYPNKTSG